MGFLRLLLGSVRKFSENVKPSRIFRRLIALDEIWLMNIRFTKY
jgi:hypothetical protein